MPPPPTRIILLGRIAIEQDGTGPAAGLAGRRSELVFAYLAVEHRRSVSRDELADALWPDTLPDTWNAALRSVISDVRRFLERAGLDPARALIAEGGRLRFAFPPGALLDVDEARDGLARARSLLASGEAAAAGAAARTAADATALPFLSGHDDGWAGEVRGELDRLHAAALELQAEAYLAAGEFREALSSADRLVRAEPYLESAHRLRITLLGATGDRAGALKAYERCKALLAAELGIEPSAETDEALRTAVAVPAGVPGAAPPSSPFASLAVLVVEDHDFQRRTTLTLLRGLGVTLLRDASDGAAALALLDESAAPDVIICDIDMPGMDGVEFIRNVAERQLASAVVFASGLDRRVLATVRAASEGYGLQVLGAVNKPLTAAALERLLSDYRPGREAAVPAGDTTESVTAIVDALDDGSLAARFEPVVDLSVGRVAGLRAVVDAPIDGDLLAAADAAGLGRRLVEHLLRQVRVAARDLDLDAFVELSPGLLTDVSLADGLAAITRERVVLVAAAVALGDEDSPAMLDVIARLRVKGFGFCIDGADTELLARLPLTHVQLPGDLVARAALTGDPAPLLPTVDASRQLGLPVIGRCSTSAEFDLLLQAGCSFAHGPYLAESVAAADIRRTVRDWTAPPVTADQSP